MGASSEIQRICSEFGAARRRLNGQWLGSEAWFRGRYRANAESKLMTPMDRAAHGFESAADELAAAASVAERMLA